jgi:hypothetical protein
VRIVGGSPPIRAAPGNAVQRASRGAPVVEGMHPRRPSSRYLAAAVAIAAAVALRGQEGALMPGEADLAAMTARFAPVEVGADLSALPPSEQRALARLIEAARVMDAIFLRQVWAGNEALLVALAGDDTPLGRARLRYFLINKGPWSRLDQHAPFIPGVPAKPGGANFYPLDATRDEVARWFDSLPPAERAEATGFFTVIRRDPQGRLVAVPYSVEYRSELALAAAALEEAAALTAEPALRRYLSLRAQAFRTNDYYASDVAWMELDSAIEPVIGPYEVYEDEWFNYKAAFEAFVTLRDPAETAKLASFAAHLQELEDHLPMDPRYRRPTVGPLAPIRVVNVVFTAGDANRGVQIAAFNLPNDERVIREKGSKRVMLKNIQEAKFRRVLVPIADRVLRPADRQRVGFEAFFTHILMHELLHGLGPHELVLGGQRTTVRQQLKETYGVIEEAKADVAGLWALDYLVRKGVVDERIGDGMYATFLASVVRSLRFGATEAHARAVALQLNTWLDEGAVGLDTEGRLVLAPNKLREAITLLARRLLTIQAEGRYEEARALIDRLAVVRPELQRVLDRVRDVPVDIAPRFVTAAALAAGR